MFKKLAKIFDKIEEEILIILFVIMVSVIFLQVIMRYVFNNSLVWSEELGKFIFVWISWLGISLGHRKREHIAITLLTDKLSRKGQIIINIIIEVILMIICLTTSYYGMKMMTVQVNVPYAAIKISTMWGYLSLILGCIFMSFRSAAHIVNYTINFDSEKIPEGGEK